ncbi:MAG: uroporphyrinogen decarboxylase family protein [Euryarchaeota archaeon]|nr:uroporphyrinogen decarboxylase family protein [Euryarchaeota archaeon]
MRPMSALQRVQATIDRDIPDRVPVVLFFQSAAQYAAVREDVTWCELLNNHSKLYHNVLQQYERYGADNFFLPLDFRLTGEAFGSKCEYIMKCGLGMRMPVVTKFAVNSIDDIDDLEVPDPKNVPRCQTVLRTISDLSRKYDNEVPIIGFLNSPADAATDVLKGHYSTIFPMMATNKAVLHLLLKKISDFNVEFGKAMINAGAFGIGSVSGGFNDLTVGRDQYKEFVSEYQAGICKAMNVPYCFHQCQDATPFLEDMVSTGCGAISFHELVDMGSVKRKYGSKVILAGNVGVSEATDVMCNGTPEEVEMEAKAVMDSAKENGMFWLSAGCEVHHALREENIFALVGSAKKYGTYDSMGR